MQYSTLSEMASSLDATPTQVALVWLLQRSPSILLIPDTPSLEQLFENMAAGLLVLPADVLEHQDGTF